jgi:hypothetical protein
VDRAQVICRLKVQTLAGPNFLSDKLLGQDPHNIPFRALVSKLGVETSKIWEWNVICNEKNAIVLDKKTDQLK